MSTIEEQVRPGAILRPYPQPFAHLWQNLIHRRFNAVFANSPYIPFDNDSKFIFFSDCHRDDKSKVDAFAPNEALFLRALTHYYDEGYTYVEVGDGDELWQHQKFQQIRKAYGRIFDLFHCFDRENRLHLLVGNHDIQDRFGNPGHKDGIPTKDGIILRHVNSGNQIFVVHGHQADFVSERYLFMARWTVRHIWRRFLMMGMMTRKPKPDPIQQQGLVQRRGVEWILLQQKKVAQRIAQWAQLNQQTIICGHTHLPVSSGSGQTPYFNTGSCINPGYITGIELVNGKLRLVKWTAVSKQDTQRQVLTI